ncbi:hypothetical protein Hanom_Chr01g00054401 [Helianthus anomalus]
MICRISRPTYVAPENDAWRHQNSDSDNEDEKMSLFSEKNTRWWCVKDGKRKRTPKSSPKVQIPKEPVPKIVIKEPQQRLVDDIVLEPSAVIREGADLLSQSFESFLKRNEDVAAQKEKSSSVQAKGFKGKELEGVVQDVSSDEDSEATESESELDPTTLGRGKAQLKIKLSKKQKVSDEEDSSFEPDEPKKLIKKRKAVQTGVIPRSVWVKKGEAKAQRDQGGKGKKHVESSKDQEPEVQNVKVPEVQQKVGHDDYVEVTEGVVFSSRFPPIPQNIDFQGSSNPKATDDPLGNLPPATGDPLEDLNFGDDFDVFNNEAVKILAKKVAELEKEKMKVETERDVLKKQVNQLMKAHDQIRMVLIDKEKTINEMKDDNNDNSKMFELLTTEISSLNVKIKNQQDVNQTLNQLLSEISEASSNEMKAMKLEMEAMKADKVMKDNQLRMLYAVMESHLKIDIHAAFNNLEVRTIDERRMERERRLAEEATQKNKSVIEEIQEAGGSSSQVDVEMVDAENEHNQDFMLVGESSLSIDTDEVIRRVAAIQKKRKAKEVLLLEWKTQQFVLVGKASSVPYSAKEIARQIKIKEMRRKEKITRGEIVDEDSDIELFGDEEGEDEDDNHDKKDDKPNDKDDKGDDDNNRDASGLLIIDPNVQARIEELMNDEINEQEDDSQHEASSSGKHHADQVFLTNPTVIYLSFQQEGETEIQRTRAEMLEELGLENGKFKFDIEDKIPQCFRFI